MTQPLYTKSMHDNTDVVDSIQFIQTVLLRLSEQKNLSPDNNIVNVLLNSLVNRICKWEINGALTEPEVKNYAPNLFVRLPTLCALAECEMEKWWARRIIADKCRLEDFWYLQNYRNLVMADKGVVSSISPERIAFLGCGALPLTAIILGHYFEEAQITCIDCDKEACALAEKLCENLGVSDRIRIAHTKAEDYEFLSDELVICASLLQAPTIYKKLFRHNVRNIIVRDVEGLFQLLYYPAIKPRSENYVEFSRTTNSVGRINISRFYERVEQ